MILKIQTERNTYMDNKTYVYTVIIAYRSLERLQEDYDKSVQDGCACQPKNDTSIRMCIKEGVATRTWLNYTPIRGKAAH